MINPLVQLSLAELRRRTSYKWRAHPEDVLPLFVAEMDVPLAEPIKQALLEAVEIGDTGYAWGTAYAEAMSDFASARWGVSIEPAAMVVVGDVLVGIVEVLKQVTSPGDAVVVNPPVYYPFFPYLEHADRRIVNAPLTAEYRLDLEGLEAAFRHATHGGRRAAYLLCTPHNPTGTVHTRRELTAVAELARQYSVRVIADEVHAPVVYPEAEHVPYLTVDPRGFALLSASKAFNLAGLKAALAVAGDSSRAEIAHIPEEVGFGASNFGILANTAALRHGGEWLDAVLVGLDSNRALLRELLVKHVPRIGYREPSGTYLAWLDCRNLGLEEDPAAFFLREARVAVNTGPPFGIGGEGHVRLNLATSPENLTEGVRRMAAALGS